jgi:hypothetical protein
MHAGSPALAHCLTGSPDGDEAAAGGEHTYQARCLLDHLGDDSQPNHSLAAGKHPLPEVTPAHPPLLPLFLPLHTQVPALA